MDFHLPRKLGAIAGAGALLLGSQSLTAECASTTFAEEIHYSCSGVLTVMPRGDSEDAESVRERDRTESGMGPQGREDQPAADEARPANRAP